MEGQGPKNHWLNPLFRSETGTTVCSSKSAPTDASPSFRSERDMKRLMRCISQSWKTIKSMPSASSFGSRDEKEVVMEGYLPTTKQSVLNFLKGMGLKPKVELVGNETIITADASVITDSDLKRRFIKFMTKQVTDTPRTALTEASSTSVGSITSKALSASSGTTKCSSDASKDTTKTSGSSATVPDPNKGSVWTPPKLLDEFNDKKKTGQKKKADVARSTRKQDIKKTTSNINERDEGKVKGEKKKDKSVGFKTVGMMPSMVGQVENPFDRHIPVPTRAHTVVADEAELVNEPEWLQSVGYQTPYGRPEGYGLTKACFPMRPYSVNDRPSCCDQQVATDPPAKKKKTKKLRIMKHLRKWFSKKKDAGLQISLETSCDNGTHGGEEQSRALSTDTHDFFPTCHFQTVSVAPEPHRVPVIANLYAEDRNGRQIHRNASPRHATVDPCSPDDVPVAAKLFTERRQKHFRETIKSSNNRLKKINVNPQAFDGSISMPVLVTPDQSCFKKKHSSSLLETSKSSTVATDKVQAKDSYSVLGDSASIHIGKKRIRLEGKDVQYGSILQNDKDFDKHFRPLKENSLSDIESQVKKAKERIMFARAVGAVGDRLPEGFPKVDYKELLMPEKNDQEKRDFNGRSQVDIATSSSFYQKFLASMNILKTTHRFDACDRSVMTDEPLSRTYAEFIDVMNGRNGCDKLSISGQNNSLKKSKENVTAGDSSVSLPATSYLKMICTCWDPLFRSSPLSNDGRKSSNRGPPENRRTEEEKILKYIVDKVVDCSRNKKGYINT